MRKKGIPIFYKKYLRRTSKYKIYSHKLYSPKDIERRTGIEEKKIIALLEEKKTIGRKMRNFWFVWGSEIIDIQKLLKEVKKDVKTKTGGSVVGRANGKRAKKK